MRYATLWWRRWPGRLVEILRPPGMQTPELWPPTFHGIGNKRDNKQDEEDKEQNFGKPRSCSRDTAKSEYTGDNRDDETHDSPIEHILSPIRWLRV